MTSDEEHTQTWSSASSGALTPESLSINCYNYLSRLAKECLSRRTAWC